MRREHFRQVVERPLPTLLQQYDRCSMAHGVECRMPFLDYRIVEFVFSLPGESLVGGGFTKKNLRESVRGFVPDSTRLNKITIGLNGPIVECFLGPLRELMLDTMASSAFQQSPYFGGSMLAGDFWGRLQSPNGERAWSFRPPGPFVLWSKRVSSPAETTAPSSGIGPQTPGDKRP